MAVLHRASGRRAAHRVGGLPRRIRARTRSRLGPARGALVDDGRLAPIVACRCEHIDHDGALSTDLYVVRDVARDRPGHPGAELPRLVGDAEDERAREAHAELLVLVTV